MNYKDNNMFCKTCRYHTHEPVDDGFVCTNADSDVCSCWTEDNDGCVFWTGDLEEEDGDLDEPTTKYLEDATWPYWDYDTWFLEVSAVIFDSMAENTHTYPPDMTYDEWTKKLKLLAHLLREANPDNFDERHPDAAKDWQNKHGAGSMRTYYLLRDKYLNLCKDAALNIIKDRLYDLWD